MPLHRASRLFFKRFRGHNSFTHMENLPPDWWTDSLNMAVNENGSAEVLRSPKGFNAAVGSGNPVISMADYLSPSVHKLLFDIEENGTLSTYSIRNDLGNDLLRAGQYVAPFISANVNNKLFRVNQQEFIQWQENITTQYRVGIDPPAAAPTIAFADDSDSVTGSGDAHIEAGIQFSYAYMNSVTGHVSKPSPISNRLEPSADSSSSSSFITGGSGEGINVPVVASTQDGVDKIVFFATEDGGDVPYLLIDSNADPVTAPNTTGTVFFDVSGLLYDTLTPETVYNDVPPLGAQFMFTWKDRVFLMNFIEGSDVTRSELVYSGFESTYMGQPGEAWPPLNRIGVPNKGEIIRGGIGTQVGALILSDLDAYLIDGYPTDKTQGPEASTTVTEHLAPLHWNIGTQSPRTIRNTPFGTVWLDQAKRLELWKGDTAPSEVGAPLKKEFAKLDSSRLDECEAQWFQRGEFGGFYAMVGPLAGGLGQRLFLVTLYQDAVTGEMQTGYAFSDFEGYSLQPVRVFNEILMFMGGIDKTFTILDPSQGGDGYNANTRIFFEHVLGNDENFSYWHSIRFDGNTEGLTLSIRNPDVDPSEADLIDYSRYDDSGLSWFALLDAYGRRKILRFEFDLSSSPDTTAPLVIQYPLNSPLDTCTEYSATPIINDDAAPRQIKNIQIFYKNSARNI